MRENRLCAILGLARKAGKLECGVECASLAVKKGRSRLVICASDISPRSLRRLRSLCGRFGAALVPAGLTAEQMGGATGRPPTAAAAPTDQGFSELILGLCRMTKDEGATLDL